MIHKFCIGTSLHTNLNKQYHTVRKLHLHRPIYNINDAMTQESTRKSWQYKPENIKCVKKMQKPLQVGIPTPRNTNYCYSWDKIDCDEEYIRESSRTFGETFGEYLKAPSPIYDHYSNSGHITSIENFKIIGREGNNMARAIKEAIYIRVNNPTLNRNIEKYKLPHIWVRVLYSIPVLKINK